MADNAEPERRHRRPASSCTLCRRRKLRCSRDTPCSNCVRSKNATCVYEKPPPPSQPWRSWKNAEPKLTGLDEAQGVSPRSSSTLLEVDSSRGPSRQTDEGTELSKARIRIRHLEDRLADASSIHAQSTPSEPRSSHEMATSELGALGGTFHLYRDGTSNGQTRAVGHKSRLYGRTNWANDVAMYIDTIDLDPRLYEDTSRTVTGLQRCKYLARIIKAGRAPEWPCPPTTDLPPKDIADSLIGCYLRTFETLYRILHIPNFKRDYEAIWVTGTTSDIHFIVQLKLIFALGAITYDDCFSLRLSAIRWVYEAQTWTSSPRSKHRLGFSFLQTSILLLLAREFININGASTWVAAGALLRSAMVSGLHRDPSRLPKKNRFIAEMRRRLWNTILELALQSSLSSGGPPLIATTDFDTQPPGNFNDEEILTDESTPHSEDEVTQTSLAVAFRKSLPTRLDILKLLNDADSRQTYQDTLRLDAQIKASYKCLRQDIQKYNSRSNASLPQFGVMASDFLMLRYMSALHCPYFDPTLDETAYAYSRNVVVETSLKIWRAAYPSSTIMTTQATDYKHITDVNLAKLTTSGSGLFRSIAIQGPLLVALDFKSKLQNEGGLGPVLFNADVLSIIEEAKRWYVQCIEAGETNVKAYLLLCIVAAQIEGLVQGADKAAIVSRVSKALEDGNQTAQSILERMANVGLDKGQIETGHLSTNQTPNTTEDWDFMVSDEFFGLNDPCPMSWSLNEDTGQPSLSVLLGGNYFT